MAVHSEAVLHPAPAAADQRRRARRRRDRRALRAGRDRPGQAARRRDPQRLLLERALSQVARRLHPGVRGADRRQGQLRHARLSRSTTSASTSSCRPRARAYDVLNITFIYSSRWIGAGWFDAARRAYIEDPDKTPPDWDLADFLPGAVAPLKTTRTACSTACPGSPTPTWPPPRRFDLIEQAGLGMPDTFDDIVAVLPGGQRQGRRPGLRHREPPRLDLDPLSARLRRRRVPQAARRPDADARHARGDRGGRVLRPPAARLRPRRRRCPTPTIRSLSDAASRAAPTTRPINQACLVAAGRCRDQQGRQARSTTR